MKEEKKSFNQEVLVVVITEMRTQLYNFSYFSSNFVPFDSCMFIFWCLYFVWKLNNISCRIWYMQKQALRFVLQNSCSARYNQNRYNFSKKIELIFSTVYSIRKFANVLKMKSPTDIFLGLWSKRSILQL